MKIFKTLDKIFNKYIKFPIVKLWEKVREIDKNFEDTNKY